MDSPLDDLGVIRVSLREPPLLNRHAIPGSNAFALNPGRGLACGTSPSAATKCEAAAGEIARAPWPP